MNCNEPRRRLIDRVMLRIGYVPMAELACAQHDRDMAEVALRKWKQDALDAWWRDVLRDEAEMTRCCNHCGGSVPCGRCR
jgi:hypothetical protein